MGSSREPQRTEKKGKKKSRVEFGKKRKTQGKFFLENNQIVMQCSVRNVVNIMLRLVA